LFYGYLVAGSPYINSKRREGEEGMEQGEVTSKLKLPSLLHGLTQIRY